MVPEQIPNEAVEAAKTTYTAEIYKGQATAREYDAAMRAAIAAALAAWPGVDYRPGSKVTKTWRDPGKIILPLPTEKSDD